MEKREKKKLNMKKQWTKFIIVLVLYLLFLYWVKSWLGLLVVPFIYDAYISKKINWHWWKDREGPVRTIMSWVDAIVFALVAVYFINQFFFQNYVIPSSSLEKSLLTGDYLFVSKVSYGPRIPQTPLTMPLTQHTLPVLGVKSYIEWPHWDYRRVKGLGTVQLNDVVVFNYPAGDTILTELPFQTCYYQFVYENGRQGSWVIDGNGKKMQLEYPGYEQLYPKAKPLDLLTDAERLARFDTIYAIGRSIMEQKARVLGHIGSRPTDRRENYVKRCVGLPGDTLQIKDRIIYLNGKVNKEPELAQFQYVVTFRDGAVLTDEFLKEQGITFEDLGLGYGDRAEMKDNGRLQLYNSKVMMPLTKAVKKVLSERKDLVVSIEDVPTVPDDIYETYPQNGNMHWTRDNYGPIWIPKKGATIKLDLKNIAIYQRPIKVYEDNKLEIKDGKIYINDSLATSYTFKMDYYWMMGDNRHNSADSRYWGFVPEDHIVGKPIFIWWSSDPDRGMFSGGIRWSRLFRKVDNIK